MHISELKSERPQEHHGMRDSSEYKIWCKMKERCSNRKASNYARYGGSGIRVCKEWRESFIAFYRDMGKRPEGMTLERINSKFGYFKENCRWATRIEQANNTKKNVFVEFRGIRKTVAEWCRELSIPYNTIRARIYRGNWTAERAFQTTINTKHRSKSCQALAT